VVLVVLDLGLPEGGDLGEAFGKALRRAEDSSQYRAWEADVVACLEDQGVEVEDGDLRTLAKPFLVDLLDLAGVDYDIDDDGNVHYDVSASQLAKVPDARLAALHDKEMAAAHQDAACRRSAGEGAQRALDAASAPLVDQFPDEVTRLSTAMTWFRDNR
jgi:hypothetical protein